MWVTSNLHIKEYIGLQNYFSYLNKTFSANNKNINWKYYRSRNVGYFLYMVIKKLGVLLIDIKKLNLYSHLIFSVYNKKNKYKSILSKQWYELLQANKKILWNHKKKRTDYMFINRNYLLWETKLISIFSTINIKTLTASYLDKMCLVI